MLFLIVIHEVIAGRFLRRFISLSNEAMVSRSTSAIRSRNQLSWTRAISANTVCPESVNRATVTRLSAPGVSRRTRPSASNRSIKPVMLPFVTMVRREFPEP